MMSSEEEEEEEEGKDAAVARAKAMAESIARERAVGDGGAGPSSAAKVISRCSSFYIYVFSINIGVQV